MKTRPSNFNVLEYHWGPVIPDQYKVPSFLIFLANSLCHFCCLTEKSQFSHKIQLLRKEMFLMPWQPCATSGNLSYRMLLTSDACSRWVGRGWDQVVFTQDRHPGVILTRLSSGSLKLGVAIKLSLKIQRIPHF